MVFRSLPQRVQGVVHLLAETTCRAASFLAHALR